MPKPLINHHIVQSKISIKCIFKIRMINVEMFWLSVRDLLFDLALYQNSKNLQPAY